MEGKALKWFQTLNIPFYTTFEALEKEFVAAHSKTGLKHDVLSQIHGFKQETDETMRDYANRLRQYLIRCPSSKVPGQERLVSIFLEGLLNKDLHSSLYMQHHKDLDQCIHEAIDYDDNCGPCPTDTSSKASDPTRLWCDFHNRWGNHSTENCYDHVHHLREQAIDNVA